MNVTYTVSMLYPKDGEIEKFAALVEEPSFATSGDWRRISWSVEAPPTPIVTLAAQQAIWIRSRDRIKATIVTLHTRAGEEEFFRTVWS